MRSRRPSFLLLSLLSLLCLAFAPPVLTNSDVPRYTLTSHQLRAMRARPLPALTAPAVVLVNDRTGEILYARNEHERRAPASLIKMITAMVALERGDLDQGIIVNQTDALVYSAVGVSNGEKLTLRELLFTMLIPSDNVAARAIARELGGGRTATFVGWMNELVARLGLLDTHCANPTGLDHKDAYSSAYDMAIVARYAMNYPVFADIVRRYQAYAGGRWLESTNKLLNTYSGMIGVKTGTEQLAGECLITVVDRPQGRVLTVIMGSTDRFADTYLLLEYYYANYAELRIDLPQTPQNRYLDESNTWQEFGLKEPVVLLIKPWQMGTATYYRRIDNLSPDPDPDEPIGALVVTLAGNPFTEIPLYVR